MSVQVRSVAGQVFPVAKEYLEVLTTNPKDANKYCKVYGNLGIRVL